MVRMLLSRLVWSHLRYTLCRVSSKELIKALVLACGVQKNQLPTFVKHLSECKNGIGLVFMHNTDSLKSMSSYQNESHIKLKDHVQVSV